MTNKREKISLGGYEMWMELRLPSRCIMIYEKENYKHGIIVELMGPEGHMWLNSRDLKEEEKKELLDYLKKENKI